MFLKELFFRFLNALPLVQWNEQEHTGRPCAIAKWSLGCCCVLHTSTTITPASPTRCCTRPYPFTPQPLSH